jgi:hypothetical protein
MPKQNLSPFLTLPETTAAIKVSESKTNGAALTRNAFIEGYTTDTELRIKVTADLNAPHMYDQLGLSKKSQLCFVVTARSSKTYYKSSYSSDTFDGFYNGNKQIDIVISPGQIADTLLLEYSLILHSAVNAGKPLAAVEVGTVLWQSTIRFYLEGSGSMFPITMSEFSTFEGGKYASWKVDWSKASLFGAPSRVRLLINSNNIGFIKRVTPDGETPPDIGSLGTLHLGVAQSILHYASQHAKELCMEEFPEGSLGAFIRRFLQTYMRQEETGTNIANALSNYSENPDAALAVLQSNLEIETLRGI